MEAGGVKGRREEVCKGNLGGRYYVTSSSLEGGGKGEGQNVSFSIFHTHTHTQIHNYK